MIVKLLFGHKLLLLIAFSLITTSIQSIYLSAGNLPDDHQWRIISQNQNPFFEYEQQRERRFEAPPPTRTEVLPSKNQFFNKDEDIDMGPLFYSKSNWLPHNASYSLRNCDLTQKWSEILLGMIVLGSCPSVIYRRNLQKGSIPITILEARCLCDGLPCAGKTSRCVAIKQTVPYMEESSRSPSGYQPDLTSVTVGCLCVKVLANKSNTEAYRTLGSDPSRTIH